ncbi:enoyl-CoA hydratase/isomerase family protein [Leptospira selangorensis]|uniref:Enoyl-CoA hydratase/isomerase family protein n=1 Tax=Leptospira selangorensis TaxID=2484982 RepID=A0A5F2C4G4_9LEPT|nr:enoyl-CoA hydratase/isomerase family protein [Leptospira selangorensis]TGM13393.1 enoyl-CoA hydratase/isomerase family protein [Leptospira selangorensis]TGM22265.1 enoyl-CoA hydratase/isomerase family protein [Leptospira selangorensis]
MDYKHLSVENKDGLLIVLLNRPESNNALNIRIRDELENVFSESEKDPKIRGILLGANGKNFCSGYDLEEVVETKLGSFRHRILEYHYRLYSFPKPLVCVLKGFCSAGGFDLALSGDYILSEKKTFLFRPEIRFGGPPLITTLARKVGPTKALSLTLLGEPLRSQDALKLGIIDEIVTEGDPIAKGLKVLEKLSQWDPKLIRAEKEISNNFFQGNLYENLKKEFDLFKEFLENPNFLKIVTEYAKSIKQKV